jgi:hypothetical protein
MRVTTVTVAADPFDRFAARYPTDRGDRVATFHTAGGLRRFLDRHPAATIVLAPRGGTR